MARFCSLFSSSRGNCTYIGTKDHGILIDVGVSAKRTAAALDCIGVDIASIGAIFITHEHTDHIAGLRVFTKRYGIPVYASSGTLEELERGCHISSDARVAAGEGTEMCDMLVRPFKTSHDSRESVGYTVMMPDGRKLAVATDLGVITDEVRGAVSGSDLVLLESNHDVNMLMLNERYPYTLKRRILSDIGHLSNESCASLAQSLVESGTTRLVLGHLSPENNYPRLAYECTKSTLDSAGMRQESDYLLTVAGGEMKTEKF